MKKVAKALTKRKPEKEDKGKLETSVHYHTRSPTRPPPSTPSASKRTPCIHSTPIAQIDSSSLEETIDSSPEVDPEVSFKPTHQSDLSSGTEDDTSSEASELLRNAQLSWDDSSHAGEMDQQQEGVAYAEPTPDDNQQPTATSSNAAGNPPTVTLEMLMQVLNTRMDEQKRDINAKMEEQKEDNKAMRIEVREKMDEQKEDNKAMRTEVNEKIDNQSQDLKDLALKLDQSIEYFKNANNDFRGEVVTSTRTQSSRNQVVDQQVKFNQIHGEETSHYQDEIGTTPDLSQKTETESGQNSIQKPNDHTQEDEDIEKPVTVLEEILPRRTEILEVPPTQELHEDEYKAHNFTEDLLPEHIHDAKKFQKPPMEVSIDYDVLQVNRKETAMEGIQFGMDRESCLSFHYYPEPERRITLLRPHISIALIQKSPRMERTAHNKRSLSKNVTHWSTMVLKKILTSLKYTGPPPEKGPPHKKSEKIQRGNDDQWLIIRLGMETDFELLNI